MNWTKLFVWLGIAVLVVVLLSLAVNLYNSFVGGQFFHGGLIANAITLVGYAIAFAVVSYGVTQLHKLTK